MTDAIVIGAGVVGASIALELQRSGSQVTVVDKGDAVGGGSTSASASIIRHTYSTIEGVAASWESTLRWLKWSDHLGHSPGPLCTFHQIGMLMFEPDGMDKTAMLQNFDEIGIRYEELGPDDLATRFPAVDTGKYWPPRLPNDPTFFDEAPTRMGALFMADGGFIDDPQLAAVNLMDAARHHGADVRLRTEVVAINRADGRVSGVTLGSGEELSAPVVVNAAGPWSRKLNELADVLGDMNIGTRALRRDMASTTPPAGHGVDTGGAVMGDIDLGTYSRPQPGGSFIAGGVESECDTLVWVDDPDLSNPNPDPEEWEVIMYRIARRLPDLAIPHRPTGLSSHYDVADDWIPIYDRTSLDGFYVAIGTSGNQFKNAPIVGEIMRDLIYACESGQDHDADPVQYNGSYSGLTVDLGHYSRKRSKKKTSNTVMG